LGSGVRVGVGMFIITLMGSKQRGKNIKVKKTPVRICRKLTCTHAHTRHGNIQTSEIKHVAYTKWAQIRRLIHIHTYTHAYIHTYTYIHTVIAGIGVTLSRLTV
jgi:hypothetical protein